MWRWVQAVGWSAALVLGVLWPARLIGPMDGAPLDRPAEALAIGLLLPALWFLHPRFPERRAARFLVAVLLAWKIAGWMLLTQTGWCGTFVSRYDLPIEAYRLDRSWDLRTFWTSSPPACSAIVARPYRVLADFPAWIINMPFPANRRVDNGEASLPVENPRPPEGRFALKIDGFINPPRPGILSIDAGSDVLLRGAIGGKPFPEQQGGMVQIDLDSGQHAVDLQLELQGADWRFVPRWNGRDVFGAVPTTTTAVRILDGSVEGWGSWVAAVIVWVLILGWLVDALVVLRPGAPVVAWTILSAGLMGAVGAMIDRPAIRFAAFALSGAVVVSVPERLRNIRGAFLLIGVGWLAFFAGRSLSEIGHFTIYSFGDDWLMFQRFAHRIYIEGYWLEGGQLTFWWQPLYRWIAGALHLAFGDSSVGEIYGDAVGLLIGALCAFEVVRRITGFRAGIVAAVMTLATVMISLTWYLIGRGLSEVWAAAWIYLTVFSLMRSRGGAVRSALAAGVFGVLAFFTRLNHLPMLVALAALTLPDSVTCSALLNWRLLWAQLPKRAAVTYILCVGAGIFAFALRTWHYTGHFSVFYGTQLEHLSTGLGLSGASLGSLSAWRNALGSALMIVSIQDPPRFDIRAVLVMAGVACALLGLFQVPPFRRLPLGATIVCVAGIAGGLVARGVSYPGRFSVHLIPIAVGLSTCAGTMLLGRGPMWPARLVDR